MVSLLRSLHRDVSLVFVRCENFALYLNKRLLSADPCCRSAIKEFAHGLAVRISNYGCT